MLFEIQAGNTGLTETAATRNRIEVVTGAINSKTKADYFPGRQTDQSKTCCRKRIPTDYRRTSHRRRRNHPTHKLPQLRHPKRHDHTGISESRHSLCATTLRNMGTHGTRCRNGLDETTINNHFLFLTFKTIFSFTYLPLYGSILL